MALSACILWFTFLFALTPVVSGSSYCYGDYCSNRCCGDLFESYCCVLSTGEIVGIVFACIFGIAILIAVVCAMKKSKSHSGRILAQPNTVIGTSNTAQNNPQYPPPYNYNPHQMPPGQQPPPPAYYMGGNPNNPPPPGYMAGNPNNPPPPGYMAQAGNPNNPPPPGYMAQAGTPNAPQQSSVPGNPKPLAPNPFAAAAQKSS